MWHDISEYSYGTCPDLVQSPAEWIAPAFQRYYRGLDYEAQGWTRDIWAGLNMCSVERFRAQRRYQGFEECGREL